MGGIFRTAEARDAYRERGWGDIPDGPRDMVERKGGLSDGEIKAIRAGAVKSDNGLYVGGRKN